MSARTRRITYKTVIGQVYGRTADIKDATIFAIAPAMIPGYGMGNALEMHTQDKGRWRLNDLL